MRKQMWVFVAAVALMGISGGELSRVMAEGGVGDKKITDDQVKGLVEKLGSEDFKVRTGAHKDLVAAGAAALPALEAASHSGDAEVAEQAKGAMQEIRKALSAAATEALAKQQLWCYAMDNGAAWSNNCPWPVICGGTGYVAGMDGKLHAVDLQTGKERWTTDLGAKGFGGMQVSAGEKFISVLQGTMLTVYDSKEGKQLWQKDFKPVKGNGGNAPGAVLVPGARTGAIAAMRFQLPMSETWVVGDLVVARVEDKIHAYKGASGDDAWEMDVKRPAMPCGSIVENGVAFIVREQTVAAIDLATQKELWSKELPECTKLLRGGGALVCSAGTKIVALEVTKGEKLWEAEMASGGAAAVPVPAAGGGVPAVTNAMIRVNGGPQARKVAVDGTRVYVVSGETLTTLDLKSGANVAALDISDDSNRDGAAAGGNVITIQGGVAVAGGAGGPGVPANMMMIARVRTMINQVVAADGTLYAVINGGIVAFEGRGGGRLWMMPLKQALPAEPVVVGGVLYYATNGQRNLGPQNNIAVIKPQGGVDVPAPVDSPLSEPGLHALNLVK